MRAVVALGGEILQSICPKKNYFYSKEKSINRFMETFAKEFYILISRSSFSL